MMSVMSMRRTTTCTFSLNVTRHVAFVLITSGIRHITDLFLVAQAGSDRTMYRDCSEIQ